MKEYSNRFLELDASHQDGWLIGSSQNLLHKLSVDDGSGNGLEISIRDHR